MLQISEAAANHLRSILTEKQAGTDMGLRVWVEKGGCAGYQYEMKLDGFREGDLVAERGGMRVWVDEQSVVFLDGALLDYCDDLMGSGFRIVNPRAARSCGCGTSFEPAPEQPVGAPAG
jgi:iron-sulfur cluster assembly protein